MGSKYKLIPFIKNIVEKECKDILSVADIFAGTGVVADAFKNKKIITNDILYSNYVIHNCFFGIEEVDIEKIKRYIEQYNELEDFEENYMSINFADTFFSKYNCKKIGYIREDIENKYNNKDINKRERSCLITSLLFAMDKIANTCGHYDAYRQGADLDKELVLLMPELTPNSINNEQYNIDTNKLVREIEADLVYIDPPYNSRQYCDAYHLLENVACWEKPEVEGVARKMDRTNLKSDYCTKSAPVAFEDLIKNIKAKYILVSYNNMGNKGNDRSNARISDEEIIRILKAKGTVKVFEEDYKAFTTGKSDIKEHKERLFLCICKNKKDALIQSPLNYTGGKYKLLPQILPLFPNNIDTFIDLFAGGCNVGINADANTVIFNEKNKELVGLLRAFKDTDKEIFFDKVLKVIKKYKLSESWETGYPKNNSSDGLASVNKDAFLKLREDFNKHKKKDLNYYVMLYTLIVYAFNNQIRFNSNGEYNLPVGKRDFNKKMQNKLNLFLDRISDDKYKIASNDFRKFDLDAINKNDFIYCDPPYLITTAGYNEQNGWTEQDENDLLSLLDKINSMGVKFALSNVLTSKGKENSILIEWSKKYNIHHLNYTYSNSNYQTKDKKTTPDEVLITNY